MKDAIRLGLDLPCGCVIEKDIWCVSHAKIRDYAKVYDERDGAHLATVALKNHTEEIARTEEYLHQLRVNRLQIGIAAYLVNALSLEAIAQYCGFYGYHKLSKYLRWSRQGWPPGRNPNRVKQQSAGGRTPQAGQLTRRRVEELYGDKAR